MFIYENCFILLCIFTILIPFVFSTSSFFEKSNGKETDTYLQAIEFYKNLGKVSSKILLKEMKITDEGCPLHLVLVSNDGKFDPAEWHKQNKVANDASAQLNFIYRNSPYYKPAHIRYPVYRREQ